MTGKKVKLDQPARHPEGSGEEPEGEMWPPPAPSGGGDSATRGPGRSPSPPKHRAKSGVRWGSARQGSPISRPRGRSARPTPGGEDPGSHHLNALQLEYLGRGRYPRRESPSPNPGRPTRSPDPKTPLFV